MKIQTVKMVRKIRDDYYIRLKNRTYEERKAFFHEMSEKVNSRARSLIENRLADNSNGAEKVRVTQEHSRPEEAVRSFKVPVRRHPSEALKTGHPVT